MRTKMYLSAMAMMSALIAVTPGQVHAEPVCPPVVKAEDHYVGGQFDVDSYLAALAAALGECAPKLPKTGSSDSSQLLGIGLGLGGVGVAIVATAAPRRRAKRLS